jgi:hypothetical protein
MTNGRSIALLYYYLLAFFRTVLGFVVAEEEFAIEELDADHGENQEKQDVDDENVEHIFQGDHNTVKHSLECGNTVYHFQRPQHAQQLDGLQLLPGRGASVIRKQRVTKAIY